MLFNRTLFNSTFIVVDTTDWKRVLLMGSEKPIIQLQGEKSAVLLCGSITSPVALKGCDYKIMENQDFKIYEGDDLVIEFLILDEDGNTVDLTGYSASWGAYGSDTTIFKSTGNGNVTIGSGTVEVTVDAIDTVDFDGVYRHELRLIDASTKSRVAASGTLTILRADSA